MMETQREDYLSFFVKKIFSRRETDKGFNARLKGADNSETLLYALPDLAKLGIPIDEPYEYLPFTTIAAAICKSKMKRNGTVSFGRALYICFMEKENADVSNPWLRRLLACERIGELCSVLQHTLSLIRSKKIRLDFISLLRDLTCFSSPKRRKEIKRRWIYGYLRRNVSKIA